MVMAALTAAVWRHPSTDVWVLFKVFGLLGLTLLFSVSQVPLMTRHRLPEAADDSSEHE